MVKSIIATTLSGLFISEEPWKNAHILWYKEAAEKLKDDSIMQWANKPDYFKGVDLVMQRLYPDLSGGERTKIARETYFNSVIKYIKQNRGVINKKVIKYFTGLKKDYRIALITTNTKNALEKILKATELETLFDIIEFSDPTEKDDKRLVFERFIKRNGKPKLYIGGSRKDSYDYCKEKNIPIIFANFENQEKIEGVNIVRNLEELKIEIEKL